MQTFCDAIEGNDDDDNGDDGDDGGDDPAAACHDGVDQLADAIDENLREGSALCDLFDQAPTGQLLGGLL